MFSLGGLFGPWAQPMFLLLFGAAILMQCRAAWRTCRLRCAALSLLLAITVLSLQSLVPEADETARRRQTTFVVILQMMGYTEDAERSIERH